MGAFVGIIAGFVGGVAYNKYYNFRKRRMRWPFFNGKRRAHGGHWLPVVISIVLSLFWPVVQTGINNFGIWIANSSGDVPVLGSVHPMARWNVCRSPLRPAPYADHP